VTTNLRFAHSVATLGDECGNHLLQIGMIVKRKQSSIPGALLLLQTTDLMRKGSPWAVFTGAYLSHSSFGFLILS
jgi:hypothetical protein